MATCSRKMSHFLFFQLFLILGNLLENTSCLIDCLTLLKEINELEQVSRHHHVKVHKLELMNLGLRKEALFTLFLRHGYFHHSMEVATFDVAEKLYLMLHEFMHWHESGLLGSTKPADQMVAYVGESGNGLEVILDAFVEVCLCMICIVGALLCNDVGPFGQVNVLKALTHQVKQQWTIVLLIFQKSSQNL
jgi:hypothetical protein